MEVIRFRQKKKVASRVRIRWWKPVMPVTDLLLVALTKLMKIVPDKLPSTFLHQLVNNVVICTVTPNLCQHRAR